MLREVGDKIASVAAELMNIFSATVTTDSVAPNQTEVALDTAPNVSVPARSIGGRLEKGARVMCLAYPPRGLLVLGRTDEAPAITPPYMAIYSTPGTTVWNKPDGLVAVRVRAVGAGGGGAGTPVVAVGQCSMGGGGSGGLYAESWLLASALPASLNVVVPGTTTQAAGAPGNGGGFASFGGFVVATGGSGGTMAPSGVAVTLVSGGTGFVAGFVGQINIVGSSGSPGIRLSASSALGGNGGSSVLGGGGLGAGTSVATGGYNFGGGGGGQAAGPGAATAGGAGAQGVVLLEYFFAA